MSGKKADVTPAKRIEEPPDLPNPVTDEQKKRNEILEKLTLPPVEKEAAPPKKSEEKSPAQAPPKKTELEDETPAQPR